MPPPIPTGYRVDKSAWALVLFSLTIVAVMCWGWLATAGEVRRFVAYRELKISLGTGRFGEAANHLDTLLNAPAILKMTNQSLRVQDDIVRGSTELLQFISEESPSDPEAALDALRTLMRRHEFLIDRAIDGGLLEDMRARIRSLDSYVVKAKQLDAQQRESTQEQEALQAQLTAVAQELAGLLGTPRYPADRLIDHNMVYQSGVLSKLPVIRDVPDGITDLTALATTIEKLGGGVQLSATNQYEAFQATLIRLRERSERVLGNLKKALEHQGELQRLAQATERAIIAEFELLKVQLQAVILATTSPRSDTFIGKTLERFFGDK